MTASAYQELHMDYQIEPTKPKQPRLKDLEPGDTFVFETGTGVLYMVLGGNIIPNVRRNGNRAVVDCGTGAAVYAGEALPVVRVKGQFKGEQE